MKKLSLLLFAICLTVSGWAASLNPYAYDLSSTWNEATSELTVRFKLNAHPNMKENSSGRGIQIFAIDPSDNNKQYYIYGVPGPIINAQIDANSLDYELTIPITGVTWDGKEVLPAGKNLTWAVNVAGLNSKDQSSPVVVNDNIANRPYSPHGIAVNNDQNSPDFGSIYVTECTDGVSGDATWNWLASSKGRSLLKYDPTLKYQTSYRKHKDGDATSELFSLRNGNNLLEPHRVRISDDGRIFVSSYNQNGSETGKPAVWELSKTTGKYTEVITHNPSYGDRVVGMAVKGSGTGLKLLLCYWNLTTYVFKGYEYAWNGTAFVNATLKFTYTPSSTMKSGMQTVHTKKYFCFSDGFVNVAYGAKDNSTIWLGIDMFLNTSAKDYNTRLVHFSSTGTILEDDTDLVTYGNGPEENWYYGGGGFVPYVDQNTKTERIAMGRAKIGNGLQYSGRFCVFDINNGGAIASVPYKLKDGINTGAVINDFAIDRAHNVYAVSFTTGTTAAGNTANGITSNGTGRLVAIALPYDGATMTMAPQNNNNVNFQLKPIPNILATDLRYGPYGNENRYEFSFNVNTKPEVAQIRFYENEADMLACNNNYAFYYQFPDGNCKQGSMSVIFDAVGGKINGDKTLQDMKLPAGLYYWNVYVKTRKSYVFAPIYTQPAVAASDYHRQHATVDNNPDNDGFGHVYVADHHNIANSAERVHYVRAYTIGNATNAGREDNQSSINDNTRYTTHWQVKTNNKVHYTRRPTVSPDGLLFVADEGSNQKSAQPNWFKDASLVTYGFSGAGLHIMDPQKQTNNANAVWEDNFSVPNATTGNQEVTTGAYFLKKDGVWKLYRTNTYEEFTLHPEKDGADYNYRNARWNTNGYRVYNLTSNASGLVHSGYADNSTTEVHFGAGDAGGQFSIVATEYGVWMCQHRENTVANAPSLNGKPQLPDNEENIILSFFDHNGARKFTSYTYDSGNLTQTTSSVLQSTPGAGMAYQKRDGVEYLYVVNHAGNILEFKITGGATPNLTHTRTYTTGNSTKGSKYEAISSMNFDYAGNLVVTAGEFYGVTGGNRDHQELVVYTMPYPNKENARSIPAPKSCRKIPERVAQLGMDNRELELLIEGHQDKHPGGCAVDIYRPLQGDMFNTICLPFTLNLTSLPEDHPLKGATVREYYGLKLENIGGEDVLELQFKDVTEIVANIPYIIQPRQKEGINHIVRLDGPIQLQDVDEQSITKTEETTNTYSIIYKGVIPYQYVEPKMLNGESLTMMLVADNRLALMTSGGNMLGFRGYFNLNTPLKGIKARITNSKGTTTNTTIVVDGKKVNVEKYLREGRVYIRVGETLYTIDGQKVE